MRPQTQQRPPQAPLKCPSTQELSNHTRLQPLGDFLGSFELKDNRILKISGSGRKLFAELDGGEKAEIVAVGKNIFEEKYTKARLKFSRDRYGLIDTVSLILPGGGLD